ncbi:DAO domain-containing protein [Fusarium keratoplasticum]|nr:DAO domain-containing protein [Fusarium keratoplasticum]
MERYDVAVVGLGALGSGAAYHAAIKGAKVIGFEQFELGHVRGASHDTSRIVRTSYENPEFVALARSAYKDWAELERRSGLTLLNITGGVVLIPRGGPTLASNFMTSLETNGIPFELLDTKQVNKRWPGFRVPHNVDCVYTADTGIVHASKAVTTMQYQARANGAVLREKTRVELLTPTDDGVIVQTSTGQVLARKVIIAADAWVNKLLKPLGAEIPQLTVMQEQITYFKPSNPDKFDPERFPVWIWGGETWYYGFPTYGEPTIKAGQDAQQNIMAPDQRTFQHSPELQRKLTNFMDTIIPDHGEALRTVTCQYALTPDRQFMIGPLKKHPDIIVAMGNGHAFKFAPAIGRVTAELAIDGNTSDDISKFPIQQAPESKL